MFILRLFPLSNSTEEETGRHIYKKKKPKNKKKIKPKETKKKLLLEFAKSLPVAVLLLFCLVNNYIQVFNVPASLRCLIPCSLGVVLEPWFSLMRRTVLLCQRRRLTCKIYTGRPFTSESLHKGGPSFFASTHFRTGSTFSFFMNYRVNMILVFFFFIAQSRWLLYSSITTHQHCVFSCSFLNIWMPLSLLNSTFD